jgi:ABC-2 type transport system permease protein
MTSHTTNPTALRRNLARIYWLELQCEVLKHWRMPIYSLSTLLFPMMFYVLFALMFGRELIGDVTVATYMLATYGAFGVIGAALFAFGVGVATERAQGWMRLKQASPMPPLAYFVAKAAVALAFSALVVASLFMLGYLIAGIRLPASSWLALFGTLLLGALPFSAMGLWFGYLLGPNSAPVVLNLVYIPMVFVSGLWIPMSQLPTLVQQIGRYLPAYYAGQLALAPLGANLAPVASSLAWLAAYTAIFMLLAVAAYRRSHGQRYG